MSLAIAIIDYEAGNVRNVQKAVESIGYPDSIISSETQALESADVLILPGVGAFHQGMDVLEKHGLDRTLRIEVQEKKKPLLGICLGMQLLARVGYEGGERPGLGLLPMTIEKLRAEDFGLRLPHIGWNNIVPNCKSYLFSNICDSSDFYFVHSYHAVCEDETIIAATCDYGHKFVAAVEKGNIFATQFHPEKSQRYGLHLLRNFFSYCERRQNGTEG